MTWHCAVPKLIPKEMEPEMKLKTVVSISPPSIFVAFDTKKHIYEDFSITYYWLLSHLEYFLCLEIEMGSYRASACSDCSFSLLREQQNLGCMEKASVPPQHHLY